MVRQRKDNKVEIFTILEGHFKDYPCIVLEDLTKLLPNIFYVIIKKITFPEGFQNIDDQEIEYDHQMYMREQYVLDRLNIPSDKSLVPGIFSENFKNKDGKMLEIGEMNDLGPQNPFPFIVMESYNGESLTCPDSIPIVNVYKHQDENSISKVNYYLNYEKLKQVFDKDVVDHLRAGVGLKPLRDAIVLSDGVISKAANSANHLSKGMANEKYKKAADMKKELESKLETNNN